MKYSTAFQYSRNSPDYKMFDLSGLYQGSEEHSIQEDTSAPLSLNVRVLMKTRFRSVVSPSHDIQAEMKEEKGGEFEAGLKFAVRSPTNPLWTLSTSSPPVVWRTSRPSTPPR